MPAPLSRRSRRRSSHAHGTTFRYRAVADMKDGRSFEAFDAGEIDEDGRIRLILTFAGPLGEPA